MRRAFLNRVSDMIRNEQDTTFFTVDIGMWAIRDVLKEFPDRCTNVGIFEEDVYKRQQFVIAHYKWEGKLSIGNLAAL